MCSPRVAHSTNDSTDSSRGSNCRRFLVLFFLANRFRCPKGWRRFGGSCYYLSNITSLSSEANQACNEIHSSHSNLMRIRNAVELSYAAHVLTKNDLSSLMIEIEPNLLQGKADFVFFLLEKFILII